MREPVRAGIGGINRLERSLPDSCGSRDSTACHPDRTDSACHVV